MKSTPTTRHLVFGALGQDGSYLLEQLDAEGEQVVGVIRNSSIVPKEFLETNIKFVRGNILDIAFLDSLLETYKPTHLYNLASASSVSESYANPTQSLQINLEFVSLLIDSIEKYRLNHKQDIYFLQASTSEMFGPVQQNLITEDTPHDPRSPYAEHKSMAHKLCLRARATKDLKIGTVILFNHESPRRPLKFVSRKITRGAYLISKGVEKELVLGNINVVRDWGYAPDYVDAIKLVAIDSHSDDYVVATGQLRSLSDMCKIAFQTAGISDYENYIVSDKSLFRSNENSGLRGDSAKLMDTLGWKPKVSFEQMIETMVFAEPDESPLR
jgi:GDPmannose 4,6-dehydratase